MARWTALALTLACFGAESQHSFTAVQRLDESRLEDTRRQRLEWSRKRVVYPQLGVYNDFRGILHVHAEDAEHTLGTRQQVLEAAHQTGVNVILWSDHRGPKPDTWSGYREGVLFIPGSEDDHQLRYPSPEGDLKFLSHIEELPPDKSPDGYDGMEIYNRHTDAKVHTDLTNYLQKALKNKREFGRLAGKQKDYPDEVYAAGTGRLDNFLAFYDRVIETRQFTAIAANDAHRNQVFNNVVFDPYEVSFRFVSTHILARDLEAGQIRDALRAGHAYVSHDWLCDPSGFSFIALNNLGAFDMGDRVPAIPKTRLVARFPIPAHVLLYHKGQVVSDTNGNELNYTPTETGAYRLEARLTIAGEERPWIYSNPLYLALPVAADLAVPTNWRAEGIQTIRDITYTDGDPKDANKHKLDLYLPEGKKNFPVLVFVHGGSWRSGDRSQYTALGNRFAAAGYGVVIPSYRLAPANPPPAQIRDVAAAFAWTVANIEKHGGNPKRIFIAGHSAGGHLVSQLALDPKYLLKYNLTPKAIAGVMSVSGVYDVRAIAMFGPDENARTEQSPLHFVNRHAPPFLVAYCQWDYPGLPGQAREFDRALRHNFVASDLVYIPNKNHISEIAYIWQPGDTLAQQMLHFMSSAAN